MRSSLLILLSLGLVGCSSESPRTNQLTGDRQLAAEQVIHFVRTADTTGLRVVFSDSLLHLMSIQQMLEERAALLNECGRLKAVDGPFVDSASDFRIVIEFDSKSLDAWFTFDSDERINSMDISNAPIPDSVRGRLGEGHIENGALQDLLSIRAVADPFDADTGFVRLVALLSPT
jgi:hypothetical protein